MSTWTAVPNAVAPPACTEPRSPLRRPGWQGCRARGAGDIELQCLTSVLPEFGIRHPKRGTPCPGLWSTRHSDGPRAPPRQRLRGEANPHRARVYEPWPSRCGPADEGSRRCRPGRHRPATSRPSPGRAARIQRARPELGLDRWGGARSRGGTGDGRGVARIESRCDVSRSPLAYTEGQACASFSVNHNNLIKSQQTGHAGSLTSAASRLLSSRTWQGEP
jgi:hypothetical protein